MFKIGQKVVCKDTTPNAVFSSAPHGIKKGVVYTISALTYCPQCLCEFIELKEVSSIDKMCASCDCHLGACSSYHSYRFEPLIEDKKSESISIKVELPSFSLN